MKVISNVLPRVPLADLAVDESAGGTHGSTLELDMKPAHVILRFDAAGNLKRRQDGQMLCALVDYELLEKIPAAEG